MGLKPSESHNENSIWLRLSRETFNTDNPSSLCWPKKNEAGIEEYPWKGDIKTKKKAFII